MEEQNDKRPIYHKPVVDSRPLDKFFFICGANGHTCGGATDTNKKIGTCLN